MNINNFVFNGDYPIDQIVYLDSGSFIAPPSVITTVSKAHNLTFKPLPVLTWSTNPSFTISRESNLPAYDGSDRTSIYTNSKTNSSNIVITTFNPTASSITIYWRAFGFMPSNVNVDTPATASLADTFTFNPEYNYTKLYKEDYTDSNSNVVISHSFGNRLQVVAWREIAGEIVPLNNGTSVIVSNNSITFVPPNIHYRIYADKQV